MINRLLEKLARWYFVNYVRPVAQEWFYAEVAKQGMKETQPRKRYVGE